MEEDTEQRRRPCTRRWLQHYCCHNIFFHHPDWRVFAYSTLLPFRKPFQVLYLIYRWALALYFLAGLIHSVKQPDKYLTYLTNWTFITFNLYLLTAACTVTVILIGPPIATLIKRQTRKPLPLTTPPKSSRQHSNHAAKWYHMIQGPLYVIGNEMSFLVVIYYWILLYKNDRVDFNDVNVHILNGIVALVDLWVSGVPIKLLHMIYPMTYGGVYIVFTGIYQGITGCRIYEAMDYREKPWTTSLLVLSAVFLVIPFIHVVVFYCQYIVKQDVLTYVALKCANNRRRVHNHGGTDEIEEEERQDSLQLI